MTQPATKRLVTEAQMTSALVTKVQTTGIISKIHGPITQAAYDALTPAADTLYIIIG